MNVLGVLGGICSALAVNEFSELSPWAARKIARWSARLRYVDRVRAEERSEELAALIDARPGKLFKLVTALCFAVTAIRVWMVRAATKVPLAQFKVTGSGALALNIAAAASLTLVAGFAFYESFTSPEGPASIGHTHSPTVPGETPAVSAFIAQYFSAINAHDYQGYSRLLAPEVRATLTATEFHTGYDLASDSDVRVRKVSSIGGKAAATITFISRQPAADSPSHTGCTRWDITLYLIWRTGKYLVGMPPARYHATYGPCS